MFMDYVKMVDFGVNLPYDGKTTFQSTCLRAEEAYSHDQRSI